MWDVLTIFDICVDLVLDLGKTDVEFDQKERYIDSFSLEMGGSACIFACQCAKLGLRSAGVGVAGEDAFGRIALEKLRGAGVDTSLVRRHPAQKTGLGVLLNRGADRAILTYGGTIDAVTPDMIPDSLLRNARHLHIASCYLLSGVRPALPDIARRAKRLGLSVSLDTNWDPEETWLLPEGLLESVDVFLPNENEIRLLSGCQNLEDALERFSFIPHIAVKRGREGALARSADGLFQVEAPQVPVADTVGADDSFDGGFLYGWLSGLSTRDCLRAGVYCGSMNVRANGGIASQANQEQLRAWLGR